MSDVDFGFRAPPAGSSPVWSSSEAAAVSDIEILLRRCATVRTFDRLLVEELLARDLNAGFEDVASKCFVERLPGPEPVYRLRGTSRDELFATWWEGMTPEGAVPSPSAPEPLRELSRHLVDRFAGDATERLYHLAVIDAGRAATLFTELFDAADRAFDLPRCHELVHLFDDRQRILGPVLAGAIRVRRQRLEARSLWAQDHWRTRDYLERESTRLLPTELMEGSRWWVLQLEAGGGMGKTMFVRATVTGFCTERGIPCSRIDLDFVPHLAHVAHEPWRLLLRVADHLNKQFDGKPFEELLGDHVRWMADVGRRSKPLTPDFPVLDPVEGARLRNDVVGRFVEVIRDQRSDPFLVLFDTTEMLLQPQLDARPLFALLAELHSHLPAMRLILAGRFDLGAPRPGATAGGPRARGFELLASGVRTETLAPFDDAEAEQYLTDRRGLARGDRAAAIVAKAGGDPLMLALLADAAIADSELTAADIASYQDADLLRLVERVVKRIIEPEVRWLLRYGVVARQLTSSFVRHVMMPFMPGGGRFLELDDPARDPLPPSLQDAGLFPTSGKASVEELWERLWTYASPYSWVLSGGQAHDALIFHPRIAESMRRLLREQPVYQRLHQAAIEHYDRCAREEPEDRALHLAEIVYHRYESGIEGADEDWLARLDRARAERDDDAVLALCRAALDERWVDHALQPRGAERSPGAAVILGACLELTAHGLEPGEALDSEQLHERRGYLAAAEILAGSRPDLVSPTRLNTQRALLALAAADVEPARHLLASNWAAQLDREDRASLLAGIGTVLLDRAPASAAKALEHAIAQADPGRQRNRWQLRLGWALLWSSDPESADIAFRRAARAALTAADRGEALVGRTEALAWSGRDTAAGRVAFHPPRGGNPDELLWKHLVSAEAQLARHRLWNALCSFDAARSYSGRLSDSSSGWSLPLDSPLRLVELGARLASACRDVSEGAEAWERLAHDRDKAGSRDRCRHLLCLAELYLEASKVRDAERTIEGLVPSPDDAAMVFSWRRLRARLARRHADEEALQAELARLAAASEGWPASLAARAATLQLALGREQQSLVDHLVVLLESLRDRRQRLAVLADLELSPIVPSHLDLGLLLAAVDGDDPSDLCGRLRWAEVLRLAGRTSAARRLLNVAARGLTATDGLLAAHRLLEAWDRSQVGEPPLLPRLADGRGESEDPRLRPLRAVVALGTAERRSRANTARDSTALLGLVGECFSGATSGWVARWQVLRARGLTDEAEARRLRTEAIALLRDLGDEAVARRLEREFGPQAHSQDSLGASPRRLERPHQKNFRLARAETELIGQRVEIRVVAAKPGRMEVQWRTLYPDDRKVISEIEDPLFDLPSDDVVNHEFLLQCQDDWREVMRRLGKVLAGRLTSSRWMQPSALHEVALRVPSMAGFPWEAAVFEPGGVPLARLPNLRHLFRRTHAMRLQSAPEERLVLVIRPSQRAESLRSRSADFSAGTELEHLYRQAGLRVHSVYGAGLSEILSAARRVSPAVLHICGGMGGQGRRLWLDLSGEAVLHGKDLASGFSALKLPIPTLILDVIMPSSPSEAMRQLVRRNVFVQELVDLVPLPAVIATGLAAGELRARQLDALVDALARGRTASGLVSSLWELHGPGSTSDFETLLATVGSALFTSEPEFQPLMG